MKFKIFRKKFGSIFGLGRREVTETEKASMRRAWFAAAIAAALSFGGTTVARAEENNASFEGENPEMVQVLTDDELNEVTSDSYVDVEVPEIFVDNSDDYVEEVSYEEPVVEEVSYEEPVVEEVSYEEPAVEEVSYEEPVVEEVSVESVETVASEENAVETEETVTSEETTVETEETEASEDDSYTNDGTPVILVDGDDASAASNESSSAEASSTISVDASGNQTISTVTTETTEEGEYIVETTTEETITTNVVDWAYYTFEVDGRRYVFTTVEGDSGALVETLNERYGTPSTTEVYSINQLKLGKNILTFDGVNLTVYLDKNGKIKVEHPEVIIEEKLDVNLNPVQEETEQTAEEQKSEEIKQTIEELKEEQKSDSTTESTSTNTTDATSTNSNIYEVARDSYVGAVDLQGRYYIYIGGTGLDHNQRDAFLQVLKTDHPEFFANGEPIIENGVTNFDLTGKKVVLKNKIDDLAKNDEASHDPNAKPGDKPHNVPEPSPTPTPPTPTPPTPTTPTPTTPTPTPPTPTTPTPKTPTPKIPVNNIPKTGDSSNLVGAVTGLFSGLTMFGAGLASSRKKLSRETVVSFGYMESGSAYEKAMIKKYGRR